MQRHMEGMEYSAKRRLIKHLAQMKRIDTVRIKRSRLS
jgi:hypothetical protein